MLNIRTCNISQPPQNIHTNILKVCKFKAKFLAKTSQMVKMAALVLEGKGLACSSSSSSFKSGTSCPLLSLDLDTKSLIKKAWKEKLCPRSDWKRKSTPFKPRFKINLYQGIKYWLCVYRIRTSEVVRNFHKDPWETVFQFCKFLLPEK